MTTTTSNYLLSAVTANTVGGAIRNFGGSKVLQISGMADTGGGSLTLDGRLADDLNWTTLKYGGNPAVFTADGIYKLDFWSTNLQLRATLSGASGTFSVTVLLDA